MRKALSLLIVAGFYVSSFAIPDNAIDFTVKDTKGVEHHLFAYLDAGKYVLIDFIQSD